MASWRASITFFRISVVIAPSHSDACYTVLLFSLLPFFSLFLAGYLFLFVGVIKKWINHYLFFVTNKLGLTASCFKGGTIWLCANVVYRCVSDYAREMETGCIFEYSWYMHNWGCQKKKWLYVTSVLFYAINTECICHFNEGLVLLVLSRKTTF